jgi:hypothetical protein
VVCKNVAETSAGIEYPNCKIYVGDAVTH